MQTVSTWSGVEVKKCDECWTQYRAHSNDFEYHDEKFYVKCPECGAPQVVEPRLIPPVYQRSAIRKATP